MANIQSDGQAEDLIRAFVQLACAEGHLKTLMEKATAQLEGGIIDVFDDDAVANQTEKINELEDELTMTAELRRSVMLRLFEMYDGDKDYWCMVKHLGVAAYNLFEVYQASDGDMELLTMAFEANKRFIRALTRFLGTEITDCASCFADFLKGEKK